MKTKRPPLDVVLRSFNPRNFFITGDGILTYIWSKTEKLIVTVCVEADKKTLSYATLLGDFKITGSGKTSDEDIRKILVFILMKYRSMSGN